MRQDIEDCSEDEIWDGSVKECITDDYRNAIGDGKLPNRYWVMFSNAEMICKKGEDEMLTCDWDESIEPAGGIIAVFDSFYDAVDWAGQFRDIDDDITIKGKKFLITNKTIEDRLVGQVWELGTYNYSYTEIVDRREQETHSEIQMLTKALREHNLDLR